MKRFTAFALAAVFCFGALTACSEKNTPTPESAAATAESGAGDTAQLPNPWTSYDSMDALNTAAGTALHAPNGLEVTDEAFSALTALAGDDTEVFATADNALWLHWFDGDTQYSLYAVQANATDFAAVCAALR